MILYFGSIPLGLNHLTGPTGDEEEFSNTFAEHKVTRGKPVLQDIGAELATRDLSFFFDEGFCSPIVEYGRLRAAQLLKTPAPLVVPGMGYRGQTYVVETLRVRTQATTRSGRLVRLDAKIGLLEAPIAAGLFSAIGAAVAIGASALAPALRK